MKNKPGKAHYFLPREQGYFLIQGPDRIDFLQRQTTNDIQLLGPGQSVLTVLTNSSGRILDVFQIFEAAEDQIGLLPLPGRSQASQQFLKSRIFFMDKVSLEDRGNEFVNVDLGGPQNLKKLLLEGSSSPDPSWVEWDRTGALKPYGVLQTKWEGVTIRMLDRSHFAPLPIRMMVPKTDIEKLRRRLEGLAFEQVDFTQVEMMRVQAGLAGHAVELTETYTPLEVGLAGIVSATKGCYTGQEVLARQVTYDKITRQLVNLRLESEVAVGDRVTVNGTTAGSITSTLKDKRPDSIALAVLKRPHYAPGTSVVVETGEGKVAGTVIQTPSPT